jgi:hypothetical protein
MSITHKSQDTGKQVLTINCGVLNLFLQSCLGRVKYDLGSKPALGLSPCQIIKADCSGFIRGILFAATNGQVSLPEGSWYQRQWFQDRNFKKTQYRLVANSHDHRLRIAFIDPNESEHGHVWLILDGKTVECFFGKGVGQRRWNYSTLYKNVDWCFVVSDPLW